MRLLRKLGKGLAVLLVLLAVPALYIGVGCRGDAQYAVQDAKPVLSDAVRTKLASLANYQFPEEKSYLTFPEWYIVYASQDYADHISQQRPSSFAYFTAATEFWTSYCRVNRVAAARYPFNFGTQVMIYVIGVSHSAEFIVKGVYEITIGRIFEWFAPERPVDEEVFAQRFTHDYGQWLNTTPWYDFDFWGRLQSLWSDVPKSGDGLLRKWERRLVLSAELALKSGYGALIGGGTNAAYAPAELEIRALISGEAVAVARVDNRIRIEQDFGDGTVLVVIPRYQPFTEIALKMATTPMRFIEVGGNHRMFMSLRVKDGWKAPPGFPSAMFEVSVLAPGGGRRIGLDVSIGDVLTTIAAAEASGAAVEHVYDY
jgi:hypothetical protein